MGNRSPRRLLITGGSSYLGRHLVPAARREHDVAYTWFSRDPLGLPGNRQLDLRAPTAPATLAAAGPPDTIVHLAGSNRSPDMTAVIEKGAAHVVEVARRCNARLIHLSTDTVFDGSASPYAEDASPRPVHAYGRAKAAAEAIVATWPNHVIIRTSLIYSNTLIDPFTAWAAAELAAGRPVTLFTNQVRRPIEAHALARSILALCRHDFTGIINVVGPRDLSRAELGAERLAHWSVPGRERVTLAPDDGRRWPLDLRLTTDLADRVLGPDHNRP